MKAIPWTYDARPDTRTTNVRVGLWLFLASEAMFFGSLFSAYVLLRAGAESWPDASGLLDLRLALLNTGLLFGAGALIVSAKAEALTEGKSGHHISEGPRFSRGRLYLSAALGAIFLAVKMFEYRGKLAAGLHTSTNILLACWFTLTAVHALHVAAGVAVNAWLAASASRMRPAQAIERLHAARLYWLFVDAVWIVILISFYFV